MLIESSDIGAVATATACADPGSALPAGRLRPRPRVAVLGALGAMVLTWAFAPFLATWIDAVRHHRVFLGVSGFYPMDGLQYLAWATDARHGLIRNLFGGAGHGVFIHPIYSPSGWVMALTGLGPVPVMAFWKLISCIALAAGCARLAVRHISAEHPGRRTAVFVLAVFGGLTPVAGLLGSIDPGLATGDFTRAAGDLIPAAALWDYAPLAVAIGLMPFVIDGVNDLVAGRRDRRTIIQTATLGLVIAWLHPWQGETVIVVGAGLILWLEADRRRRPGASADGARRFWRGRVGALLPVLAAIGAPLVYYLVLSRIDSGWATSEHTSVTAARIPAAVVLTCVAPLLLIALAAGRRLAHDPTLRAVLLWPAATLITVAVSPSGQYRALDGLMLPLAVLAVRAWPAPGPRRIPHVAAAVALAALLVPTSVYAVDAARNLFSQPVRQYTELARSDVRAAAIAARGAHGAAVLAPVAIGTAIPALADVASWDGHPIWTPDQQVRGLDTKELFRGRLSTSEIRLLIATAGAHALLEPCAYHGRLTASLAAIGFREVRVGCARVYLRR